MAPTFVFYCKLYTPSNFATDQRYNVQCARSQPGSGNYKQNRYSITGLHSFAHASICTGTFFLIKE